MKDPKKLLDIKCEYPEANFECRFCFEVRLYFKKPLRKQKKAARDFLNRGLEHISRPPTGTFSQSTARYSSEGYLKFKKWNKSSIDIFEDYLNKKSKEHFCLDIETSESLYGISDMALHICDFDGEPGYLRLILPDSITKNGKDFLQKMALELIGSFNFLSGYIGYGINVMHGAYQNISWKFPKVSTEFPGVDITDPYGFRSFEAKKLSNINWITLINKERVSKEIEKKLRGLEKLDCTILELNGGIGIRSGESPQFGKSLEPMKQTAASLSELMLRKEDIGPYDSLGGELETQKWIERLS